MTLLQMPAAPDAGTRLAAHLQRLTERFADAAARVQVGGDDEAVHDLRVAARRLESALQTWRLVLARRPCRRARRLLRRIRRAAGPVRDAEVHATQLAELAAGSPLDSREALDAESARLTRQLARRRARLTEWLSPRRVRRVVRRVARACDGLASPPARAGVDQVETRRQRALAALLEATPTLDDTPLHDARIAVKRWRYSEESLAAARGADSSHATRGLRAVQSGLGRIHDRATLRDLLLRAAERAARRQEPTREHALRELAARLEAERVHEVLRFRDEARALTPMADAARND